MCPRCRNLDAQCPVLLCAVGAAALALPAGPEPRTSAQTKLTARPGGWCSPDCFLPSSPHGSFGRGKGLRSPSAIQCSGSKCEVRRGCRWKQGQAVQVGESAKGREQRGGRRGTALTPTPRADAETSELRGQCRVGQGPSSSISNSAAGERGLPGTQEVGGVKEAVKGSHGGLSGSSPTLGNGGEPHLQMKADGVPQSVCSE